MKMVYEAAHALEAHMIADLLRQEGIAGKVEGEYLVGAMGGLPATGLVRVVVDEEDYERARHVIERWSAAEVHDSPRHEPPPPRPAPHWPYFAAGLMLGAAFTHAFVAAGTGAERGHAQVPVCRP